MCAGVFGTTTIIRCDLTGIDHVDVAPGQAELSNYV